MTKTEYFNELTKQISDPVFLTDKTNDLKKEIEHNHWVLTAPSEIVSQTTTKDFLEFIQKVKDHFKDQLDNSEFNIDLTFYLWFEEPGELCFNFINSNHKELPFGCKLKFTVRPEDIIEEYINSKYHDHVIPWDELETIETPEEMEESNRREKELHDNFILTVYKETILKQIC